MSASFVSPSDQAAAYFMLANAAALVVGADEAVAVSQAHVRDCVANVSAAEKYLADNYTKPTFHDLWKENFGRR